MQVGEIRAATVDDFKQLLDIVLNNEGWEEKPGQKGGVKVWTKSNATSPVKMIKLTVDFDDVSALTLYDVLHDPHFRPVWDESMIEGLDIYKIDDYNDIGYYSLRCPPPLKNRDFVNQRSWGIYGEDHMIMNHTIDIEEMPVKKNFVRGVSYLTGYVVRDLGRGCSVYYITQNDPGGQVPKWLLNRISSVIAPKVLEKIHAAALGYEVWKTNNNPEWRPWRGIGTDDKIFWPRLPNSSCRSSNSTPNLEVQKTNGVQQHNGLDYEGEALYGSLDSLATPSIAGPGSDYTPLPRTQPAEEIRSNVFNVPAQSEEDTKAPLLRHESITLRLPHEDESLSNTSDRMLSRQGSLDPQPKRGVLINTKSFDSSEQQQAAGEQRGLYHSNSVDRTMRHTDSVDRTMRHTDSVDTTGGNLSDLCQSINQLTAGPAQMSREEKRKREKMLTAASSFASVSMSTHPIDPDCCTRVSRHTLGHYGNSRFRASSKEKHGRSKVATIPESAGYKVKKTRNYGDEGLESSSLKFFSKMSKSKSREKLQKSREKLHRKQATTGPRILDTNSNLQ